MAFTYTLGKDYTINGIAGVSELTVTDAAENVDITTRYGEKPLRFTAVGLGKITLECSVIATAETTFDVGGTVSITCDDFTGTALIVSAPREEGEDGAVTYRLTLTPGTASAVPISV
jgi:predicted secreted protein